MQQKIQEIDALKIIISGIERISTEFLKIVIKINKDTDPKQICVHHGKLHLVRKERSALEVRSLNQRLHCLRASLYKVSDHSAAFFMMLGS